MILCPQRMKFRLIRIKQLVKDHRDSKKLSKDLKPVTPGSKASMFSQTPGKRRKTIFRVTASCNMQSFPLLPSLASPGAPGFLRMWQFNLRQLVRHSSAMHLSAIWVKLLFLVKSLLAKFFRLAKIQ